MKTIPVCLFLILLAFLPNALWAGATTDLNYSVIFYSGRGGNKEVYILQPGEGEPRNLTNHPAQDLCPAASPDGKRIAFLSDRSGRMEIHRMDLDGSQPQRLTNHPAWDGWAAYVPVPAGKQRTGREPSRPLNALVLLGEWFGDAYFPLKAEIEARGWTQKRVGVEAEYRGCYNKKRDVVLTSEVLIPDLKDLSAYDVLIVPSGPQFRKFKENPIVLEFLKKAHASGMLIASFCVGNFLVQAAGLAPEGAVLFPEKVTKVRAGLLLGPRGGGPPPGDGFESAPIQEICDAIEREWNGKWKSDM